MPIIHLGNSQAVHHVVGASGEAERTPLEGDQVTEINLPDGVYTLREQIRTVTHRDGIWPAHSDADRPSWVHCSDPELEAALMDYWGCRAGGPDDFMHRLDELHLVPRRDQPSSELTEGPGSSEGGDA
jgi:hypothetical protein